MAIAAALNILVASPSEQLKRDLKAQGASVASFANHVNKSIGDSVRTVASDAEKMTLAIGAAFRDGLVSVQQYAKGLQRAAATMDYVNAGGANFNAMEAEAAKLTEKHTSAIKKQVDAMARLVALKQANLIDRDTFDKEWDDRSGAGAMRAAADASRMAAMQAGWAALERKGRANDDVADARRAMRDKASAIRGAVADSIGAEARRLNELHAAPIERLRQAQLNLNAAKASGLLTERAYAKEMRASLATYKAQATMMGRLGLNGAGLKSMATMIDPKLIAAGFAIAGVKQFAEFEKAMDRTQVLVGATRNEMVELSAAASELGAVTVFSAKDAAEGMQALAQGGFDVDEIMQATRPTMDLAAVGMISVADAAEITSRAMSGMHIPANQLTDAVDALAVASSASLQTVQSLGEALKFAGPVAHQAGMAFDDVLASLMSLGNAGLQGELGGTGLRNILLDIANPSREAQAAIDDLGISFQDANGRLRPMAEILSEFESKLSGMGPLERLSVLGDLFQARGATTFSSLLNTGSGGFQELLDALKDREGVASAMADAQNDNL